MTKKSAPVAKTTRAPAEAEPTPTTAKATGSTPKRHQPARAVQAKPKPILVAKGGSKIETVVNMLRAKQGASLEQLSKATGWQHHSVRGAISGNVKKKLGLNVTSERVKGVRIYRIGK